jgi:PAS domain-containing protein
MHEKTASHCDAAELALASAKPSGQLGQSEALRDQLARLAGGAHDAILAAALRQSHAMLVRTEQLAGIGGWHWDVGGSSMLWSDELCRLFGRDPAGFVPGMRALFAAVHRDGKGAVMRLTGTARDITTRRRTEEKIREKEAKFRSPGKEGRPQLLVLCRS